MNILKKYVPEHIKRHPRKNLLKKSPVAPGENGFMDCRKLWLGIAPPQASIADKTPMAYDQGSLGYCFATALKGLFETEYLQHSGKSIDASALFIGNMTKYMDGTFGVDNGSTLSGGIKALRKYGVCHESEFPYLIERFDKMPDANILKSASEHQVIGSYNIKAGDVDSIEMAIANGYSVGFGMKLFKDFESDEVAKTGMVPTPHWYQYLSSIGGHAMRFVAYDRNKRLLRFRNSWDVTWGDHGDGYISYDYAGNSSLVWDLVVITQNELNGEYVR